MSEQEELERLARIARTIARKLDCEIKFPVDNDGETHIVFEGDKNLIPQIIEELQDQLKTKKGE